MTNKDIKEWLDSQGIDYEIEIKALDGGYEAEFISGKIANLISWSAFAIENEGFSGGFSRGKMHVSDSDKCSEKAFEGFKKDMLNQIKRYKHLVS